MNRRSSLSLSLSFPLSLLLSSPALAQDDPAVIAVDPATIETTLSAHDEPVLLFGTNPEICPSCVGIEPLVEQWATANPDVHVLSLDSTQLSDELAERWQMYTLPIIRLIDSETMDVVDGTPLTATAVATGPDGSVSYPELDHLLARAGLVDATLYYPEPEFSTRQIQGMIDRGLPSYVNFVWGEFHGVDMSGMDLTGHRYTTSVFVGADLSGANVTDAEFIGCDFTGADLSGIDWSTVAISWNNICPDGVIADDCTGHAAP